YQGGKVDLETYFAIARGLDDAVAGEMTKWCNINYHYIVQQLDDAVRTVVENRAVYYYKEAKEKIGIDVKHVLLEPVTSVALVKGYDNEEFEQTVEKFIPLYTQILQELKEAGATWVQIDEPIFSTNVTEETVALADKVYGAFAEEVPELNIIFQTYFEKIFH